MTGRNASIAAAARGAGATRSERGASIESETGESVTRAMSMPRDAVARRDDRRPGADPGGRHDDRRSRPAARAWIGADREIVIEGSPA